ncbi:MAG: putative transcriptional regulator [Nocardia sp.]|uniref:TetR/AcrR family transcriptional regulator n=1 Tax=Nocardia sp. TaxID=1821 RepID=UPI00262DCEA9|nr:TetR/AcrR family transcriptional regulator [Nocardia sp.]MCU1640549.1 putative transcriptional regulator [Nocardia sp.]
MDSARDETGEKILDAALARILQVGIRRSSLDDIARRAGVNRMTIYRRFSSKEKLVDAVLVRENQRVLQGVSEIGSATEGVPAQIEETVLYVIQQTRQHPLVRQLLEVAPEEILQFYTVRGEVGVGLGIDYITGVLEAAQQRGVIDRYDPRPVAELLARFAHSLLLTPVGGVDFSDAEQARGFVRAAIVPLVLHGIAQSAEDERA